jgi:hypothetical protein
MRSEKTVFMNSRNTRLRSISATPRKSNPSRYSGERRHALSVNRDDLSVEHDCVCGQRGNRLRDDGHAIRPIVATAGVDAWPLVEVSLRAIAVVFDLVQPALALGWRLAERRNAGLDEAGRWRDLDAFKRADDEASLGPVRGSSAWHS